MAAGCVGQMLATTNYGEDGRCGPCGCTLFITSIWQYSKHRYTRMTTLSCASLYNEAIFAWWCSFVIHCHVDSKGQFWKPRVCHAYDISMVLQVIVTGLGIFEWSAKLARRQL